MPTNRQIKIRQFFFRVHVRMAILYHTAKFNSNNGVKNVVLGQTAKFNDRQYFRLYGITIERHAMIMKPAVIFAGLLCSIF